MDKMQKLDKVNPSNYRQAASLVIWLARLKPIVQCRDLDQDQANQPNHSELYLLPHINEKFALFVAITMCQGYTDGVIDAVYILNDPDICVDLVSTLRYRMVSRHAMAHLLQLICEDKLRPGEDPV